VRAPHISLAGAFAADVHMGNTYRRVRTDKLLAGLIPTINSLTVDTWQFFPSVSEFLDLRERQAGKVIVGARERHIATVARQDATETVERHICRQWNVRARSSGRRRVSRWMPRIASSDAKERGERSID